VDASSAVSLSTVRDAARRIAAYVRRTPLAFSPYLSRRAGARVWLKLECMQPTGSFKVRGALNKIGLLSEKEKSRGVVTGSAGNHGLGVAYAAQAWGVVHADVYVPVTAPQSKVDKLRAFGIGVHQQGATYEDAHQAALSHARRTGGTYVEAYDDLDIIAGQGTMGLEILEDLQPDVVIVPVGGGGMVAGVSIAVKSAVTDCRVIGVQPEASPAALLSLRDGRAYDPHDHAPTIADGLAGGFGRVPFEVAGGLIDEVVLADERSIRKAIYALADREQLIVEPSGAIAVAPLLDERVQVADRDVVCILSGRNIDTSLLRDVLTEYGS